MPAELPSRFQTPAFNEAGQDMLTWALNLQGRRLAARAAAQSDAEAKGSGDDTFPGGGGDALADTTGTDVLADNGASTRIVPRTPGNNDPSSSNGEFVVLPDGSKVPDPDSPTGYLMSPVADLSRVAAAGRETGFYYRLLSRVALPPIAAAPFLYGSLDLHLGHGGSFDYQRRGNLVTGYTHFPQFRHVSNFNVGLFGQQAGLSLDDTLSNAGRYARVFSGNAKSDQRYGLDETNVNFITAGYNAGKSGVFGRTPVH